MKIGITEAGDAGLSPQWQKKMDSVDGAILITKDVNDGFISAVMRFADKVIVHATCTGFGGGPIEPNVPTPGEQLRNIQKLIDAGFPAEKVVVRIDPIIPTTKGVQRAQLVVDAAPAACKRFRVSVVDMYPHVRERFSNANLPLPYGDRFNPVSHQYDLVDEFVQRNHNRGTFESCAEPRLLYAVGQGCISAVDLDLLNLTKDDCKVNGYQRKNCLCIAGKVELLGQKKRCPHRCLYCYWQD